MEAVASKPTGRPVKYNWGPIEHDMDKGLSTAEIAEKYSLPKHRVNCRRRERRRNLAEMALAKREEGLPESGEVILFPERQQTGSRKPEKRQPDALIQNSEPSEVTDIQLLETLGNPEAIAALKPGELQSLMARRLGSVVAQGLAGLAIPETAREIVPLAKLFRDMSGLSNEGSKDKQGLLAPPRSFGRRPVGVIREAEVVVSRDIDDEMDGDLEA